MSSISRSSSSCAAPSAPFRMPPAAPRDAKPASPGEAPYFADGVYARAKANRDKLANYNRARVDEPRQLAAAIRAHYESHPLVKVLKQSLAELSEEHGRDCFLKFEAPTYLALTRNGFKQTVPNSYSYGYSDLGDSVPVGDRGTATAARTRIDAMLAKFADDTEKYVTQGSTLQRQECEQQQQGVAKRRRGFFRRLFRR